MRDGYFYSNDEEDEAYEQAIIQNYLHDNNIKVKEVVKEPEETLQLPF